MLEESSCDMFLRRAQMGFMATFIVSGMDTGEECHKIARETLQDLITNLQQVLGKDTYTKYFGVH